MSAQSQALAKAEVLSQALPWLLKFKDAILVIKFGGNAMIEKELFESFAQDITFLKLSGIHPVVIHGGGPQISLALKNAGIETRFIKGLRYTDEKSIQIIRRILVDEIQADIVSEINKIHDCAVGISGDDLNLLHGEKITNIDGLNVELGLVGEVTKVEPKAIFEAISAGKVPVISTLARDKMGQVLNINADFAASAIASAVEAKKMIILTDVIGLMSNYPDPESLISFINARDLSGLLPKLDEGMKPKMQACLSAVQNGVSRAHVIDGRIAHGLMVEIFTDQGAGTMVVNDE